MNPKQLPITLEYEYTPEIFQDFIGSVYGQRKFFKIFWIVFPLVMLALIIYSFFTDRVGQIASFTLPILLISLLFIFIGKRINKRNANTASENGPIKFYADKENVKVKTTDTETTHKWDAFIDFKESKLSYLLFLNKMHAYLVPKDAFQSEEQRQAFIQLCEHNIGGKEVTVNSLVD